jgi:aspartate/methionine/tyrosine aminotransferase
LRYYGKVRCDLATSGMPIVPLAELGEMAPPGLGDLAAAEALLSAIAAYNDVPCDEAVATLGTTHAIWLAYVSVAGRGDEILVEDPAYEPLVAIAEGIGATVARFRRPREQRFALDPDRVERAMSPRTKIVVVSDLHNPSGVRADREAMRAIAELTAARGAFLLVDEVYAPFDDLVDERGVFGRSARKLGDNVLSASSLSKCYGLGPQRIGWLVGPPAVIRRARDAVLASVGALPLAHARVGLSAFQKITHLAGRSRSILSGKRQRVDAWRREAGLRWSAPDAGLFGFVHVPGSGDITGIVEAAARERGVLVAPGAFFGIPEGFRLAWSAPMDVLDEGLRSLTDVLSALPGRETQDA